MIDPTRNLRSETSSQQVYSGVSHRSKVLRKEVGISGVGGRLAERFDRQV